MKPKRHIGTRILVKYVGGDYHGETKQVRGPVQQVVSVAKPPTYFGDNYYSDSFGYQEYVLRQVEGELYYVWREWIDDFDANYEEVLARTHESENNRKIRLEKEEKKHQRELAKKDFEKDGIAIELEGKRVDPKSVRIFINTEHPQYDKLLVRWIKHQKKI